MYTIANVTFTVLNRANDCIIQQYETEQLKPDYNGLFSLVLPNNCSPSTDPVDLECIFGQAGEIHNIGITKGYTFIRYKTAKEAVKAMQLFGEEYHLQLPRVSNKTTNMPKEESLLGPKSPPLNGKKDFKSSFSHQNGSMKSSDKFGVFIANIENEEDFHELIRPYQPTNVKVINKENKTFAFITVKSIEVADRMIEELNNKVQNNKKLYVTYNKNMKSPEKCKEDDSQSVDTESSNNSHFTTKRSSQKYQSPVLENGHSKASTESTGMPKLIHESELPDSEERRRLCWCIFISNFPPYSLDSTLRKVFEKYHVMDLCIQSNSNHSLTKAVLYLATVFDVIDAIREMNGFLMDGCKLLVSVPYYYKIERQVVYNALEREEKNSE